jgi:O-antigen ligase
MFKEKPFFGWGPNTYQFKYAPYQLSKEMTIISTNFGDGGNAHSEYIGPLTESGVFGALSVIAMIVVMITRATLFYSRCKINEIKNLTLTILLSLITYFVHGMLNNFLDTDKAAVPVFGFMAMLVALEVYHSNNTTYQPNTL